MRKLVATVSTFVAMTTTASAADLGLRGTLPSLPEPEPEIQWTGGYVGFNGGGILSSNGSPRETVSDVPFLSSAEPGSGDFAAARVKNESGGTAGGQVGYNFQVDRLVAGVEADYNWANVSSAAAFAGDLNAPPVELLPGISFAEGYSGRAEVRSKLQGYGTLRARFGVLLTPQLLVYATGGGAAGSVKSSVSQGASYGASVAGIPLGSVDVISIARAGKSGMRWGWTVGGGVEYALSQHVTVKGEYLYMDLGTKDHVVATKAVNGFNATIREKNRYHIVRAGMNYRF